MASRIILIFALCLDSITNGVTHVGEPCNKLFRVCLASNSYCDADLICRCKPEFPVTVAPHTCKKGRHYGEQCKYSEECRYFDANSYCTQLPYRSICECYTSYIYSETTGLCEAVVTETPKSQNLILPTAIGLSLAFASILCCCMVLWHLCKRQNFSHWHIFNRNEASTHPNTDENQMERQNSFLGTDEALPNYDTALTLKSPEDEYDLPPSYEEVVATAAYASGKT